MANVIGLDAKGEYFGASVADGLDFDVESSGDEEIFGELRDMEVEVDRVGELESVVLFGAEVLHSRLPFPVDSLRGQVSRLVRQPVARICFSSVHVVTCCVLVVIFIIR